MSDLDTAYDNLGSLVTGDADVQARLGDSVGVLKGNREVEIIGAHELPALVLELGDSNLEPVVTGHEHGGRHVLKAVLVWEQRDEDTAFADRLALVPAVVKALMGDPNLGGAVDGAWVSQVLPDYGYHHPRQSIQFDITADVMFTA